MKISTKKLGKILMMVSASVLLLCLVGFVIHELQRRANDAYITELVAKHASAWQTGDAALLEAVLHEEVVFAYPGRRLNKAQTIEDLEFFKNNYRDTKVYVHRIIIDGNNVAVEWQFATTKNETGKREVVSDAIIAHVKDGKFDVWKEYLDGRVKGMQAEGTLELEEGKEPFPWPMKIPIPTPISAS